VGLPEIVFIAAGLAMDAFAVAVTLGLSVEKPKMKEILAPGLYFGFFQALMPVLGHSAGARFADGIEAFDHWIAFALLGMIGGKMIKDSFSKGGGERGIDKNAFRFARMLALAVATSIDALAVGVTFAFFKVNIYAAASITGATTFFIAMGGVAAGHAFGAKFKSKAEFIGGAALVVIGVKIVAEHILF
jgi:putative Mn2+ efflux pump MntP